MAAGLQRTLSEHSSKVWHAVAAAGHRGMVTRAIYERFTGVIAESAIESALSSLRKNDYIEFRGANRWGHYAITSMCKVPKGEMPPLWLSEPMDDEDRAAATTAGPIAPGAVNSVFSLAKASAGKPKEPTKLKKSSSEQRARGAAAGAAAKQFNQVNSGATPALGWGLPFSQAITGTADPTPGEAPDLPAYQVSALPPNDTFLASLNSDGELYIMSGYTEVNLPIEHAKKLFKYLDLIRGTDTVKLTEALS